MWEDTKKTAPSSSTAIDVEQPITKNFTNIINDNSEKNNDFQAKFREEMYKFSFSYLDSLTMNELYENTYEGKPSIIDGLLYIGTYLFVGAPKVGKSFFVLQLAYCVSTGTPLWNNKVKQGNVLYLALEDNYARLQSRLYRMFGVEGTDNLHLAISAKAMDNGLEEQLREFIAYYPKTRLVIIDTLQKIRENTQDRYSYSADYEIIGKLKKLADETKICLLLVHHTRKQQAEDRFDRISGTNGLMGAADGAFLLEKEKRTENIASLDIVGRDQQDQRLYIKRDEETLAWSLEKVETELWKLPVDEFLENIAKHINKDNLNWSGTATQLVEFLQIDIKPNVLTKKLNVSQSRLASEYGIKYEFARYHDSKKITLSYSCVDCVDCVDK